MPSAGVLPLYLVELEDSAPTKQELESTVVRGGRLQPNAVVFTIEDIKKAVDCPQSLVPISDLIRFTAGQWHGYLT